MNTENNSDRHDPRAMLATIALATDLPLPETIHFHLDSGVIALDLSTIADGQAWSRHLGGKTNTRVNRYNGLRYLDHDRITWHGWTMHLHAHDPALSTEPLPADTVARLTELATA